MADHDITSDVATDQVDLLEQRLQLARDDRQRLGILLDALPEITASSPHAAVELAGEAHMVALRLHDLVSAAIALGRRAQCQLLLREHSRAVADATDAYQIFRDYGEFGEAGSVALCAADACRGMEDLLHALDWYRRALESYTQHQSPEGEARALQAIGEIHISVGNYTVALEMLLRALAIYDRSEQIDRRGSVRSAIGRVYALSDDLDAAFRLHSQALEDFRASGNLYLEVLALGQLGALHSARGEDEAALHTLLTALAAYQSLGDTNGAASSLVAIAAIHERSARIDEARDCLTLALGALANSNDHALHSAVLLRIGEICLREGEHIEAIAALNHAHTIAEQASERQLACRIDECLSRVYEAEGHHAQALECYKRFATLQYELAGLEKQRAIAELQIRFDVQQAESQREIYRLRAERLEEDNRKKEREIAAYALSAVQQEEAMAKLKKRLESLQSSDLSNDELKRIAREISSRPGDSLAWKGFIERLDGAYQEFNRSLSQRYSDLTPAELRICMLIRLGMSNKEIADVMTITTRTVETHRTSIRGKLALDTGVNLSTFLMGL